MNLNKLILPVVLITMFFSIFSFIYNQSPKASEMVFIDVNKMLEGYDRTPIVREEFKVKTTAMKSEVDSLISNWQNELKAYEQERSTMTKKELALKQELLSNKQQQINNYQQAVQQQLREEDQKITQTVINDINDFVKTYGEQNGYRIILGATGNGAIMYADNGADLTEEVLAELNASFNAK